MNRNSNERRLIPQRISYNYQNVTPSPRRQFSQLHQSYQPMHHQYGAPIEHRGLVSSNGSNFCSQRLSSPADPKIKNYYEPEVSVCFFYFISFF